MLKNWHVQKGFYQKKPRMPETKIWARWHTKMQWSHQSQKNSWSYFCCNKLSKVQKIISPSIFPPRLWQQTILNFWAMSLGFLKTRFISKILNWKRILQKYSKLSNEEHKTEVHQRFWCCYEIRLSKTIQVNPHNLYKSFKLASLYGLILIYPNP